MNQIITYLTFNGNCREAMEFYRECLGGELKIQTIDQTPDGKKFPENFKELVVQAALKKDGMLLMGTDMYDEECNGATQHPFFYRVAMKRKSGNTIQSW